MNKIFMVRLELKKSFINKTNRKKRLAWAKERKEWVNEWENIIWSDESKFELFREDGKRWVWKRPDERYNIECLNPTVKSGQQGVMIWGYFTKNNLGPLVRLKGRVTAAIYVDVLENNLLPFIDSLNNQKNYIFQKDNAPIHTARVVKSWKQENKVDSLLWSAQSSDLNPIEYL